MWPEYRAAAARAAAAAARATAPLRGAAPAAQRERAEQAGECEPRERAAAAVVIVVNRRHGNDEPIALRVLERHHREQRRLVRPVLVQQLARVGIVELDEHVVESRRVAGDELGLD